MWHSRKETLPAGKLNLTGRSTGAKKVYDSIAGLLTQARQHTGDTGVGFLKHRTKKHGTQSA